MKHKVIIELEVDTADYTDVGENAAEVIDLVNEMLLGTADLPQNYSISTNGQRVGFNYYQPAGKSYPILANLPLTNPTVGKWRRDSSGGYTNLVEG